MLDFLKFYGKPMLAVLAFGLGLIVLFVLPVFFIAPSSEYEPNPIKTAYIPNSESVRDHPEILNQAVVAPQFFKFDETLVTSFFEAAAAPEGRDLPTMVYLHGGPLGNLRGIEMEWVARLAYPHRVLFYQQPGSGISARLKGYADLGSLASQIEWLNTFVSAKSEKPVIIIAHSFGTFTASHFAAKHPDKVRGMLFLGPSYPVSEPNLQQDLADAAGLAKEKPMIAREYRMERTEIVARARMAKPTDDVTQAVAQKMKAKICGASTYNRAFCRAAAITRNSPHPLSDRIQLTWWLSKNFYLFGRVGLLLPEPELAILDSLSETQGIAEDLQDDLRLTPLKLSSAARAIPLVAVRGIRDTIDRDLVLLHGRDRPDFLLIDDASTGHSPQAEGCAGFDAARFGLSHLTGLKPEGRCREFVRDYIEFARADNSFSIFAAPTAIPLLRVMFVEGRPRPVATPFDCISKADIEPVFAVPELPVCEGMN